MKKFKDGNIVACAKDFVFKLSYHNRHDNNGCCCVSSNSSLIIKHLLIKKGTSVKLNYFNNFLLIGARVDPELFHNIAMIEIGNSGKNNCYGYTAKNWSDSARGNIYLYLNENESKFFKLLKKK